MRVACSSARLILPGRQQAVSLAKPFNMLVDRVARDTEWLHTITRAVVGHDEFTGR